MRSGVLVWALICIGVFWKLTLTSQYVAFDDPDMAHQVIPWFNYSASQLHRGVIPLWDPHQYLGQPYVGQGLPEVVNPLAYALLLAPRHAGFVQMSLVQWHFVFLHFMAGLFTYLLCRDQKLTKAASLAGAAVFGFAGIFGELNWPMMLSGAVWGPLILRFVFRVWRDEQTVWSGMLAGVCLGLAWLSGHHQIPIFYTLLTTALLIYGWWKNGERRFGFALVAALGAMFLVSAAQTLPAWEYGHQAIRWAGAKEPLGWKDIVPYNVHQRYALGPLYLFNTILTGFLGSGVAIFVGGVALSLALLGGLTQWRERREARAGVVIALVGLAYALSGGLLLEGPIYALIPMVEKARTPSMASCVWTLGVALLVGLAVDALQNKLQGEQLAGWPRYASIAAVILLVPIYLRLAEGQSIPDARWIFIPVFLLILAALWAGWRTGAITRERVGTLLVVLLICDLYAGLTYSFRHKEDPPAGFLKRIEDERDIANYLRAQKGTFRLMVNGEKVLYNFGDQYGFDQADGYLASLTRNVREMELGSDRVERLMNIRYYLGDTPFRFMTREVFTSKSGLKVWEDAETYPRAFAVGRVERAESRELMQRWVSDPQHDLRQTAVTMAAIPQMEPCPTTPEGAFRRPNGNSAEVTIETACRQMVVISEAYDANWTASIDGQQTTLYEVDSALRGVIVPPGKHRIEMRYRPAMVYLGGALTLMSLLSLPWWRRRLTPDPKS